MIEFKILKKSARSRARVGVLKTAHGEMETPCLVPVATQAVVKTLTSEEARRAGCQILIANTFHLHIKPGEKVVRAQGGLHKFMNWQAPIMTDSAGFQVFSLGFGSDLKVGKISKKHNAKIEAGNQPSKLKITDEGVHFRSPVDGKELFIGPKESIKIQESLGADIIFAFDECTPPGVTRNYVEKSVARTHAWAKQCLKYKKSDQSLFGIVQGSYFKDLRVGSAKFVNSLEFDGYGIGGDLGENRAAMNKMLGWIMPHLDERKPRHMLGIGKVEDIPVLIKQGIDTFDCTVPTQYARHGYAFTSAGKLNLAQTKFLKQKIALDKKCNCEVCQTYSRAYIAHLVRAKEITALRLLTFHNLYFFNNYVSNLRRQIKSGKF